MPIKRTTSIYNAKTPFLIVDIETSKHNRHVNDISFGIWNRANGFIGKVGYLVEENMSKPIWYTKNEPIYREYLSQGLYQIKSFADIMNVMNRIIDKYEPVFATAYNSTFDFPIIEKNCKAIGIESPINRLIEFDLFVGACETLGQQKSFRKFTNDNGFFTEKGNRQSGAEIMYRYIRNWIDFEEEHTGYSDIEIEAEILAKVQRQKKKLSMRATNQAWRLVQD